LLFRLTPRLREKTRPLSALISNLGMTTKLSGNSFGIVRFFPSPFEPRIVPRIARLARNQYQTGNGFWKIGGLSDRPSRRMRARNRAHRTYSRNRNAVFGSSWWVLFEADEGKKKRWHDKCEFFGTTPTARLRGRYRSISSRANASCR
jgi:hypothetical protein